MQLDIVIELPVCPLKVFLYDTNGSFIIPILAGPDRGGELTPPSQITFQADRILR